MTEQRITQASQAQTLCSLTDAIGRNIRSAIRSGTRSAFFQQWQNIRDTNVPDIIMPFRTVIGVCFIAALLWGCGTASTTTTSVAKGKRPTNFLLEQALEKRSTAITALRAEGNLAVEVDGKKQQAQFVGSLWKRDSLLLSVTGPFNIAVAKVGSTPDFMNYYDALTNTVYQGAPSQKNFQTRLGVPLSHNDIVCFLRGEVPGGFSGFTIESVAGDSEDTFIRIRDTVTERVVYSHRAENIVSFKRIGKSGETLIHTRFSNFNTSENVSVPHDAFVVFPGIKATFSVQCRAVEVNPKDQKYSFVPPLEAKRRKL